ncbi:MAG: 4Fe-4S binding protein [Planctomycetota bacterium]|jgi:polyferredoxin
MVAITKKTRLSNIASKLTAYRVWIQSAFLLVWLDPLGLRLHGMCSPVFHCYSCPLATFACPIGVLANFSALHLFPFITIGLLILVGAFLGSLLCGWACPFGFLQDLLAKIPTPKFDLPKWTGHFRYVMLLVTVLAVPYFFGEDHPLFICSICPAGALEAAVPNVVKLTAAGQTIVWPSAAKIIITVLIVAAMFFKRRPWCRLFCPLGAIFGLFNRISAFFLRFDTDKCNDCRQCHKLCEYGIEPDETPNDSRCIRCLECTNCAPDALNLGSVFERTKTT